MNREKEKKGNTGGCNEIYCINYYTLVITFMLGIYKYIRKTNHFSRV